MWIIIVCIFSAIGSSKPLPAPVSSLQYDVGMSYKYFYQFTVLLNEDSNITSRSAAVGRNVGYKVSSDFVLSNVWQSSSSPQEKLLKLELFKPTLHVSSTMHSNEGINRHWSKLDNLSYPPIYIHWNNGIVQKVYLLPDTPSMINIKKGLASLFQVNVKNNKGQELDASGLCDVRYKAHGSTIKKSKFNCQRNSIPTYHLKRKQLRAPTIFTSSEMVINLIPNENIIQTVTGREEVRMILNLWKQAAVFVKMRLNVNYIETVGSHKTYDGNSISSVIDEVSKEMGLKLQGESLEVVPEEKPCVNCKPLKELVEEYGKNLLIENLGEVKSASGYLKFLDSFRRASKTELLILFKDTDERLLTQLIDVLAAAQTDDALDVAFQLVDFESVKDIGIAERFLLCLSTVPYPSESLITKTSKLLKRKIKNEKLRATVLITLSTLIKTHSENNPKNVKSLIVKNINSILLGELQACKDMYCAITHLIALRNAASPVFIPTLVNYVKKGGIPGLLALEALKDMGREHFNEDIRKTLFNVYYRTIPHPETGAQVLAAELLIMNYPTADTIGDIILSLSNRSQPEITKLVLSKLHTSMQKRDDVRSCVKELLRNTTYGNYNNLALNGTSASIYKLLQATHDANLTYEINAEVRPSGMLKKTRFDLNLLSNEENMHLMSLGIYVDGFGLTEEEMIRHPEEHSAGLQLSVLGVHLRPYVFFSGTPQLMGLVWSGALGETNPALQANMLFMDEDHSVVLQNGITVEFSLKGALSADVSGTAEVSLWNKNAHASAKNRGALLVNGFCRVDTSFVESHVDFALGGSSTLNMIADVDFATHPKKLCSIVEQPDFIFRHNVRKTETIPGSKHLIKTVKRRSIYFPGRSFNIQQKNSATCKAMLEPKPASSFW